MLFIIIVHHRTSSFAYFSSVSYVVSLIGPVLASLTMTRSLWLPFYLGIGLLLMTLPIILLLPRTTEQDKGRHSNEGSEANSLLGAPLHSNEATDASVLNIAIPKKVLLHLKATGSLLIGRRNFQLLLAAFMILALASSSTAILVQYISKRYQWTFAQVSTP